MKKRARICLYIFLVCAFAALGIVGYFILGKHNDNVMIAPRFFTFVEVEGADSYSIKASKSKTDAQYVVNCKVSKEPLEIENEYSFHNVITDEDGNKLVEETYKQEITKTYEETGLIDCDIIDYNLVIYENVNGTKSTYNYPKAELENVDPNIVCCFIAEYFGTLFNEDGTYHIECVAVDENGQDIESTRYEKTFSYVAIYENEFKKRENFFMNGLWNDYVVTDEEDLKLLVWYAILYQENDVRFYVKSEKQFSLFGSSYKINSGNINNLVIDCINIYPEYTGLIDNSNNLYAKMDGNIGTLVNFNYYLTKDHNEITYKEIKDTILKKECILDPTISPRAIAELCTKDTSFNAPYIKATESETDRTLEIDTCENEVTVYNTEQLFMVVQYGAKPKFESECVASVVYENARNIALDINNSNSLTDYEKALNIYRYICGNVVYDYVSLAYMELTQNFTVATFGNLSCFYLEGALYDLDNQYAVCDGLSKAYCLIANIEGVDCIKVNGTVDQGYGANNHAWNKVKFEDNRYNLNGWYAVDTTWGMAVCGNDEIQTHSYFLQLGTEKRDVSFQANSAPLKNDGNFYKKSGYSYNNITNDFYIESNAELIDIFNYAKHSLNNSNSSTVVIEFQLDDLYAFSQRVPYINREKSNSNTLLYNKYFGWIENKGVDLDTNNYYYEIFYLQDIIIVSVSKVESQTMFQMEVA